MNNKNDPGGKTNKGITQRTYSAWLAAQKLPDADVYGIPDAHVSAIYSREYWAKVNGPTLPDGVDLACFDYGVNSGPARANKALAKYGVVKSAVDPLKAATYVCDSRLSFMQGLKSEWVHFGKGWSARVARVRAQCVIMATHSVQGVPATAPPSASAKIALAKVAKTASTKVTTRAASASAAVAVGAGSVTPAVHLTTGQSASVAVFSVIVAAFAAWRAKIHSQTASAATEAAKG